MGVGVEQGNVFQAISHQDDVGGFHGHIGAARTHGHPDVGNGEGEGVVHAVADHHDAAFLFQLADDAEFVIRKESGMDFIDLCFLSDGRGDEARVSGEHDDFFHPQTVELLCERWRTLKS